MPPTALIQKAITSAVILESKIRGGFTILNGQVVLKDVEPQIEVTNSLSIRIKNLDDRVDQDQLLTEFISFLPKEFYQGVIDARL